jgi:hypothetical protein
MTRDVVYESRGEMIKNTYSNMTLETWCETTTLAKDRPGTLAQQRMIIRNLST